MHCAYLVARFVSPRAAIPRAMLIATPTKCHPTVAPTTAVSASICKQNQIWGELKSIPSPIRLFCYRSQRLNIRIELGFGNPHLRNTISQEFQRDDRRTDSVGGNRRRWDARRRSTCRRSRRDCRPRGSWESRIAREENDLKRQKDKHDWAVSQQGEKLEIMASKFEQFACFIFPTLRKLTFLHFITTF